MNILDMFEGNKFTSRLEDRIAVVGPRRCTKEAKERAYDLGYYLAKQGKIVVNTMSKGIDRSAILGAIDACKDGATGGVIVVEPDYYLYRDEMNYDILEDVKTYGMVLHPFDKEILESKTLNKIHTNLYGFNGVTELSVERSVVATAICSRLYVVGDSKKITGGSKCAVSVMTNLGRPIYQVFPLDCNHYGYNSCIEENPLMYSPDIVDIELIKSLLEG